MTLSHLTLNTSSLVTSKREELGDEAIEECRILLRTGGGPLPGNLRAFRIGDLHVTPGEIALFGLMRGREQLAWVIVCATEVAAKPLWKALGRLSTAACPTAPWACTQLLDGMRLQTLADVARVRKFERCAAWAALDLFVLPEW